MFKLSVASVLLAGAVAIPSAMASPALQPSQPTASIIEKTQGWDMRRCRAWRSECAERHGWRSEGFRRCLARHDCGRHRYD